MLIPSSEHASSRVCDAIVLLLDVQVMMVFNPRELLSLCS